MARNKIEDLRDHLFAALERLNEDTIKPEDLKLEVQNAKAIAELSTAVVETAKIEIEFLEAIGANKSGSQLFKDLTNQHQLE